MTRVDAAAAGPAATAATAAARPRRRRRRLVDYRRWAAAAELRAGRRRGTVVARGRLRLGAPGSDGLVTRTLHGRRYQEGTWVSAWHEPGFAFTSLIPSWSATTPRDSLVEVEVRGRAADGRTSSWDLMARWAAGDAHVRRTTVAGQGDDLARADTDTWTVTAAGGLTAYQLRVRLLRREGQQASPRLDAVGAMCSRLPSGTPATTRPGAVRGRVLDVPRYSQMIHQGHYPQWGGGGQAWCSPTSTSMVLAYYDALPARRTYAWVPDRHPAPWVDAAARATFDHGYDGTGNWAFNTAWAASRLRDGEAFVTRLTGARQAERFIAAGIPLIASVTFGAGELDGAPIGSTAGHLLVVVGFDAVGDVVVNDPAAPSAAGVRRTYDRAQFERAWLTRSGGLVYVLRDAAHPLPDRGSATAW